MAPGTKWEGDYIIAPLDQFEGLPLHVETDGRKFGNVRPHITRTVKCSPHGIHCPLFPKYTRDNDTIEGFEECKTYARKEVARRKRMDEGCPYRIAAETFKISESYMPPAESSYETDRRFPVSDPQTPPTAANQLVKS